VLALKAKLVPDASAALLQPAKVPEKVPMVALFAMFLTLRSVRPDCMVAPLLKFLYALASSAADTDESPAVKVKPAIVTESKAARSPNVRVLTSFAACVKVTARPFAVPVLKPVKAPVNV